MEFALIETAVKQTKERFLQVIKDESIFLKEVGFAVMQIKGNPKLLQCAQDSIQDAVINVALTGTSLNPAHALAFLIPRKNKKNGRLECCLDFSYRGLAQLAVNSGSVLDMDATVVHEKDQFHYEMGLTPVLKHVPSKEPDPGPMIFVYSVAILLSGIKKFIVLNKAEVEHIRKRSQAPDSDMWTNFHDEGCRKTAIKKLYKLVPKTDKLSHAIMVVNQHEGIEFDKVEKSTADVEYKQPEFGPPELLKELNLLFDTLAISQAERDMQLGNCGGDVEKLKALELELFKELEARKKDPSSHLSVSPKPDEPEQGGISEGKVKRIQILFSNAGVKDRADKLKRLAKIVNRTISTTKDLSDVEGDKVIECLLYEAESKK